jgi:hypothetical protein
MDQGFVMIWSMYYVAFLSSALKYYIVHGLASIVVFLTSQQLLCELRRVIKL